MTRPMVEDYPDYKPTLYNENLAVYCDGLEDLLSNYHKAFYNLYEKHLLEVEPYKSHYSEDELDKLINYLIDNAVGRIR